MHEKHLPDVKAVEALDILTRHYGMPRPHSLSGSLLILDEDPGNIIVVRAGGTVYSRGKSYAREAEVLEEVPEDRLVRATNWLKSVLQH